MMIQVKRKTIDWKKTAVNLRLLRNDNLSLRRYVCRALKYEENGCDGLCESCRYEMDHSISQAELAKAFHVSESTVVNWENSKCKPGIEDLLFYCDVCKIGLFDVLVIDG